MKRIETGLEGLCILEPEVHGDSRGYFVETWSERAMVSAGIDARFVQDNESLTQHAGTIRGLHLQKDPMAQAKLVRVVRGAVMDVAVDLRPGSPTRLQWRAVELSGDNKRQLFIPRGFAHGFRSLTEDVIFCYKVDAPYSPENDRSIRFDDPVFSIPWGPVDRSLLSRKDREAPLLRDADI